MMCRWIALMICLAGSPILAQSDPGAIQVLSQFANFYGGLKGVKADVRITSMLNVPGHPAQSVSEYSLAVSRPNQFAIQCKSGVTPVSIFCDGRKVHIERTAQKQHIEMSASPGAARISSLKDSPFCGPLSGGAFLDAVLFGGNVTAEATRLQHVGSEKLGQIACEHVNISQKGQVLELWIQSGSQPFLRRLEVIAESSLKGASNPQASKLTMRTFLDFANWQVDPKFHGDEFAYRLGNLRTSSREAASASSAKR